MFITFTVRFASIHCSRVTGNACTIRLGLFSVLGAAKLTLSLTEHDHNRRPKEQNALWKYTESIFQVDN